MIKTAQGAKALATIGTTLPEICLRHYWPNPGFRTSASIDPDEKQASQEKNSRFSRQHRPSSFSTSRTGDEPLATIQEVSLENRNEAKSKEAQSRREEQGRTA
jgi:hypothetical protein